MIGWLSNEMPDVAGGGGQRRQYHQIKALVAAGIPVGLLSSASQDDGEPARQLVPVIRYRPARWRGRWPNNLPAVLRDNGITRIVTAHIDTFYSFRGALEVSRLPVAVDFQNVLSRDPHTSREWGRDRELHALRRADLASACSSEERDGLIAVANNGCPVVVAPNGVDPDEWPEPTALVTRPQVLAVFGTMSHPPSRDAVTWLCREIWPRVLRAVPGAELRVIGPGDPPDEALRADGVRCVGRVDNLAMELGDARCVAVPVTWGVGTRVKFIEGLASGAPVVSTRLGAEGYPSTRGGYVLEDEPAAFADACVRLLRDPAFGQEVATLGRRLALSQYAWGRTSRPIADWCRGVEARLIDSVL